MLRVVGVVEEVISRLEVAGCVAADEEALDLVDAAPDAPTLEAWVQRREQGEPPAWIIGTTTFCGRALVVDPGVYVPRFQTEELATRASAVLPVGGRAVDLCTGSGAVAAHLRAMVPGVRVVGVDLDPRAVANAQRNGVPAVVGDLVDVPLRARSFDVVTAVAPYVPTDDLGYLPVDVLRYEPRVALDGGDEGLALVRPVVAAAGRLLRPGGWLLTEVGGEQDSALGPAVAAAGFDSTTWWRDEDGDLRGVAAQLGS